MITLQVGQRLSFRYSTQGLPTIGRSGIVEKLTDTHVLLQMLDGSPSKVGHNTAYRQFAIGKMKGLVVCNGTSPG